MRHEQPIKLIAHPITERIPTDHSLSDDECKQIASHLSLQDIDDYHTIQDEYEWPVDFILERRMLMLFGNTSEHQLNQYLNFLNGKGLAPTTSMTHSMNAVCRISYTKP